MHPSPPTDTLLPLSWLTGAPRARPVLARVWGRRGSRNCWWGHRCNRTWGNHLAASSKHAPNLRLSGSTFLNSQKKTYVLERSVPGMCVHVYLHKPQTGNDPNAHFFQGSPQTLPGYTVCTRTSICLSRHPISDPTGEPCAGDAGLGPCTPLDLRWGTSSSRTLRRLSSGSFPRETRPGGRSRHVQQPVG